jgi:hypothetical protein
MLVNTSPTKLNNRGDRGSPGLCHISVLKVLLSSPFVMILIEPPPPPSPNRTSILIRLMQVLLKPLNQSISKRKSKLIIS